ncbi:MAG: amidohydrolase [Candidatus Dormibacteraeota bacterium]|nr:amidohydrolase [Candidatus Dormibacteraeota bacterium]
MTAPLILRARRVITMVPGSDPEAICVDRGRIQAVGAVSDLRDLQPEAEVRDLGDAVIVPGFNDAHLHLLMTVENLLHLDLSADAVHSIGELCALVGREAAAQPPGSWIRGSRYDDAKLSDGRGLTRWDLDRVAPEHPVLVMHVAGHWGVVNSAALRLAGIDEATDEPPGGAFGRDAARRLDGRLLEQALFDFAFPAWSRSGRTVAPTSSDAQRRSALRRALERFHAAGITSATDAMVGIDDLPFLLAAEREGDLTLRLNLLVSAETYDRFRDRQPGLLRESGMRLAGIKTFIDGAIGGRTCLMDEPFEGTSDDYGIQTRTTAELRDTVRRAQEDGVPACVHANGDRAIRTVLGLMEEAQRAVPRPGLRHRVEHCSIVDEGILRRMHDLGAIAVPFGSYVHYHGARLLDWYGERRVRRMFAHRWFLDAGVLVAGSSDYPCGPFEPLLAMQSCVTRTGFDGTPLGPGQRITAPEALALYTTSAAATTGETGEKGTLAPGRRADLVVLGDDPLRHEPRTLSEIPVLETWVGGRSVWEATLSGHA